MGKSKKLKLKYVHYIRKKMNYFIVNIFFMKFININLKIIYQHIYRFIIF